MCLSLATHVCAGMEIVPAEKSHAAQSFKLRNGVIYNTVGFSIWIYFILSINTSIMLFGRRHIENTCLVQGRE